jgi:hypothetical protein
MHRPAAKSAHLRPVFAGFALLALAGCSSGGGDQRGPECPQLQLLPDAADLTRTNGNGAGLVDQVLAAHITAVPATCSAGKQGFVDAKVQVVMDAARGPAAIGRTAQIPYLVTVTKGQQILDQKMYVIDTKFPDNVDRLTLTGEEIAMAFPVTPEQPASAYSIFVSFRLTAAELAYNRSHPR